ncbi:multidrug transporter [Rhodoferax lacus]|uniref:Multidrug transporter n=2 Tax=Rhodoferax lacus TaxID=2184758 RepID=A0A3E1R7E3_9BURK|nr:multidrug transporter [Rhodoferax lacus]
MPSPTDASTPARAAPAARPANTPAAPAARFLSGSLLRHVVVMAGTGAIGLVAVFAVDLINLFYISLLGEKQIAAAVGFAGVVAFFHTSICIGMMIGITACVARLIGENQLVRARRMATHSLLIMVGITAVLGLGTVLFLHPLLTALGATGEVARLAQRYLTITMPSLPFLGLGMASSALLRSVGDARRSMLVTLSAALSTACLDPLFIFAFGLGLDGAAIVAVMSRTLMVVIGLHGVWRVHQLLGAVERAHLAADARTLAAIAGPAVLTNLATPVGAAFVTHSVAQFGASAVAGQATIDRVTPVAFGLIYSLSGAVGPILSQNLGAGQFARVRECMRASVWFMLLAVGTAWLLLALLQGPLIRAFSLEGVAAEMVHAFCSWVCASFFFAGALFVANTAFNNLGRPLWSTGFNWARATLGTIPFALWGAQYGPVQVMAGQGAGLIIFGTLALLTALRLTRRLGAATAAP